VKDLFQFFPGSDHLGISAVDQVVHFSGVFDEVKQLRGFAVQDPELISFVTDHAVSKFDLADDAFFGQFGQAKAHRHDPLTRRVGGFSQDEWGDRGPIQDTLFIQFCVRQFDESR